MNSLRQRSGNLHMESCRQVEHIRKMSFLILILVFDFCCLVSDVQSLDTSKNSLEKFYKFVPLNLSRTATSHLFLICFFKTQINALAH